MKDTEMRRVWGLTWIGWCNVFLQFLCLRLYRVVESDGSISKISLKWAPIWRVGWSLPTRTPAPPGYPSEIDPSFDIEYRDGHLVVVRVEPDRDFQIVRSMTLGCGFRCRSLSFGPPLPRTWLQRLLRLDTAIVLTLDGYCFFCDESFDMPSHARIQNHYPTRCERLVRWLHRWRPERPVVLRRWFRRW